LLMLLWFASGIFSGKSDGAETPTVASEKTQLTEVRAKKIHAQDYPMQVLVRGRTEADRTVEIKAEITGQVEKIVVQRGERVEEGQEICRLAIEDRELLLEEAQSVADQAKIEYDGALRLKTGGYQSEAAIATNKSKLDTARANLLRRKINLEKISIRAPFAGVVDERPVEVGTLMRPGDTCATILDMDPLVISGQVSEADVVNIHPDTPVQAQLSTGEKLYGQIRYVSRRANDATRTFRVEAAVNNPDMKMFSHVTTEMAIVIDDVPAHLISASLLILDDDGELGVRVVDDQDRVEFYNVKIVGDEDAGVWVTGLPDNTVLITVGQEYVGNGEQVKVVFDSPQHSSPAQALKSPEQLDEQPAEQSAEPGEQTSAQDQEQPQALSADL